MRVDDHERGRLSAALASGAILTVASEQVEAMTGAAHPGLTQVSVGPVPLEEAEHARFVSFRETNGILGHVAVLIGNRTVWPDPVPVRIHSACLAGDLFGSLRCRCGEQLRQSLHAFSAGSGGVLLYLGQEGWGGTAVGSRLSACSMQRVDLDVDHAGRAVDSRAVRRHQVVTEMLRLLGVTRPQLFLNSRDTVPFGRTGDRLMTEGRPLQDLQSPHRAFGPGDGPPRRWLGEILAEP